MMVLWSMAIIGEEGLGLSTFIGELPVTCSNAQFIFWWLSLVAWCLELLSGCLDDIVCQIPDPTRDKATQIFVIDYLDLQNLRNDCLCNLNSQSRVLSYQGEYKAAITPCSRTIVNRKLNLAIALITHCSCLRLHACTCTFCTQLCHGMKRKPHFHGGTVMIDPDTIDTDMNRLVEIPPNRGEASNDRLTRIQ